MKPVEPELPTRLSFPGTQRVACPKCNGGVGWHKKGISDKHRACDFCHDSGEVTEQEAADYLDTWE